MITPSGAEVRRTHNFTPDESLPVIEADLPPVTYQMLCSLSGHAAAGQRGSLVVR